jgi:hypothetical protein
MNTAVFLILVTGTVEPIFGRIPCIVFLLQGHKIEYFESLVLFAFT